MIVTLTPNPSLDLLFECERLVWDDANRVPPPRRRAGGQGINLARAARALGGRALAIAPLGGRTGAEIEEALRADGTGLQPVPIQGETRVFIGTRERETGRSLLLNPTGPELRGEEVEALLQTAVEAIRSARPAWVVGCGSIPPGAGPELYERLAGIAHAGGARFVPDCDGEPLRRAAPLADLLVPNAHEAGRLLGNRLRVVADGTRDGAVDDAAGSMADSVADGIAAARALRDRGVPIVAVKLGPAGAVLAAESGLWHASGPRIASGSAVGAGDASLAALLLGLHNERPLPESLREGVAAGTAVLMADGTEILRYEHAARLRGQVDVRTLD